MLGTELSFELELAEKSVLGPGMHGEEIFVLENSEKKNRQNINGDNC
jgi:hypothetical protein